MRKSLLRITFRQLQVFRSVCASLSYSRAAEEMSLTQPAVSLQIRQLEELLGQPLFDYVGKKLYLTDAAEALLKASEDIFARLDSLDMQLADLQGTLQGQLSLAVETSAKYFTPHLFAAFRQQQRAAFDAERQRWIESGQAHFDSEEVAADLGEDSPLGQGQHSIESHIAGNLWQVQVAEGSTVKTGDVLVILESMKMEIPLLAPRDGVVREVRVQPGSPVRAGQRVVVLEEA